MFDSDTIVERVERGLQKSRPKNCGLLHNPNPPLSLRLAARPSYRTIIVDCRTLIGFWAGPARNPSTHRVLLFLFIRRSSVAQKCTDSVHDYSLLPAFEISIADIPPTFYSYLNQCFYFTRTWRFYFCFHFAANRIVLISCFKFNNADIKCGILWWSEFPALQTIAHGCFQQMHFFANKHKNRRTHDGHHCKMFRRLCLCGQNAVKRFRFRQVCISNYHQPNLTRQQIKRHQ